ncbi:putative IN2-2 protein [Coleophoma cylindrospora]|uniref:Putative IN2-2 protein n=1 Tax=Coleophoma cylindrospora TaxID=1849047 RepID=A0A3D8QX49_9HELO|nr:putative IN2-2 protein [Coleophoma cylindrospora]
MTTTILGRKIGNTGYGLMGLTWRPQPQDIEKSFEAMRASLEVGCNFWNGGEFYGPPDYNSLTLMEKYFTKYPEDAEKVVLSIKGGIGPTGPDGSKEFVQSSIDNCLSLLKGKKTIDLFECARKDPNTPIEITIAAMDEYVKAGKIGGIALSEVGAETIRRAAKVAKIHAVEVEVSLWAMDIFSNGIAEACAENDIPVVAYSPIGRGILSGEIRSPTDIPEGDFRRSLPRFQGENFNLNMKLVDALQEFAKQKGCTAAQLAISYLKYLSKRDGNPEIIPIPGATTASRIKENATQVTFTEEELSEINSILGKFDIKGGRYDDQHAPLLNG